MTNSTVVTLWPWTSVHGCPQWDQPIRRRPVCFFPPEKWGHFQCDEFHQIVTSSDNVLVGMIQARKKPHFDRKKIELAKQTKNVWLSPIPSIAQNIPNDDQWPDATKAGWWLSSSHRVVTHLKLPSPFRMASCFGCYQSVVSKPVSSSQFILLQQIKLQTLRFSHCSPCIKLTPVYSQEKTSPRHHPHTNMPPGCAHCRPSWWPHPSGSPVVPLGWYRRSASRWAAPRRARPSAAAAGWNPRSRRWPIPRDTWTAVNSEILKIGRISGLKIYRWKWKRTGLIEKKNWAPGKCWEKKEDGTEDCSPWEDGNLVKKAKVSVNRSLFMSPTWSKSADWWQWNASTNTKILYKRPTSVKLKKSFAAG